jgi:hypothetical protein
MGLRKPVFDIRITAQRKNIFSTVSQNELALQLFKLGFFNPVLADQATACLQLMDFEGKDAMIQRISRDGQLLKKLRQYMTLSLELSKETNPALAQSIGEDLSRSFTVGKVKTTGALPRLTLADPLTGTIRKEPARVEKARQQAVNATQPQEAKA